MRDELVIDDLETLRALGEPTRVAIVELLAEPRSVRQVAAALDVPRTRLYHHVELLVSRGLVEQVDERRAGALTERVYAVSARRFRVAPELLTSGDGDERIEALTTLVFDATKSDLRRSLASGRAQLDAPEGERRLDLGRSVAHLTEAQAVRLVAELEAFVARFDEAHAPGEDARPFALAWAIYPAGSSIE